MKTNTRPMLRVVKKLISRFRGSRFGNSKQYWRDRYARGGNSGMGSYSHLAQFKARVVNDYVADNNVRSVIEFGCGDGNQLSLAKYEKYIGLDVAPIAIGLCAQRFGGDDRKSFFLYDPACFIDPQGVISADLGLSMDVIYHLVEDATFETYMRHLFSASQRHVIIYSSNTTENAPGQSPHVRHRRFVDFVEHAFPEWRLSRTIKNEYPFTGDNSTGSFADFFMFCKAPS